MLVVMAVVAVVGLAFERDHRGRPPAGEVREPAVRIPRSVPPSTRWHRLYHPYALLPSQLNPAVNNGQPATPATFYCPRGYDPTQYRSPWPNIPSGDWTTVSSYDPPTPNSLGGRQAYNLVLSASPPSAGTAIVPPAALIGAITRGR